jgi:hypothetical protein
MFLSWLGLIDFFVSTEWDRAYPLVRVSALPKEISDHTPLLVDTEGGGGPDL